jgi:hypothetical protein
MSSPDDDAKEKVSRRRFIKRAGAFAAVGAAAIALGDAAGRLPRLDVEKVAAASPVQTSTSTVTETETTTETATDTATADATNPTTSSAAAAASLLPEPPFSIFWITDTQFLSESNPALFRMLNNWIVAQWVPFNGKMVIHTGDLVQTGNLPQEWTNADEAMSILTANKIPYTWCAGNHDDLIQDEATSGWMGNQWDSFDPKTVSGQVNKLQHAQWVDDFHSGMNTAVSFTANGLSFLVVNIEWNAQPDALEWVGGILDDVTYANHHIILAPHAYIDPTGSVDDPRWGPMLADFVTGLRTLMDAHSSNVFLTLNGHFATECGYNTPIPINNRNELMFDRQDCTDDPGDPTGRNVDTTSGADDGDKVGGVTAMILTFDTYNNQINAKTYDLYPGKWRDDPYEQYSVIMFPNLVSRFQRVYPLQ